ncbi:hypothetical protein SARC_02889 [Sphaeroforma arctica JP610]|uniref:Uncharacterized protein n=1 Tax=Sphaeroforma arctica JP610 TaxID=667725 RepID=A0A0L0G786_9EUKA|nr:hypothetical protein SARC_02889 [Sphaeroforma arctica JP610]KNC84907.1 hypothetical protein SARC_02889 [Sphaeroforma arctica JP610]|eukprot:XP_014158809.1 hypothetical protein SARC_02889 [Sphaeroforma arctica JP610]
MVKAKKKNASTRRRSNDAAGLHESHKRSESSNWEGEEQESQKQYENDTDSHDYEDGGTGEDNPEGADGDRRFALTIGGYIVVVVITLFVVYLLSLILRDERMYLQEAELRSFVLNVLVDIVRGCAFMYAALMVGVLRGSEPFYLHIIMAVIFPFYLIGLGSHYHHALEYESWDVATAVCWSALCDLTYLIWPLKLLWRSFVWFTLLCGGRLTLLGTAWDIITLVISFLWFVVELIPSVALVVVLIIQNATFDDTQP